MFRDTILVFGGAGYVGSVLIPKLLEENYKVKVFDTFWYGNNFLPIYKNRANLELIKGDIRDINAVSRAMQGSNIVIHLACISNDPSFDLDPKLGKAINLDSFLPLVRVAKISGVNHFIYASSSSVYGIKQEEKVTENLTLEPLTDYSRFKMICEDIVLQEQSTSFASTVLRPATVCGVSPRQRFDLSVNILTNHAFSLGKITVLGGLQTRPNLHIEDMARSYIEVIRNKDKVVGEIFNIGGENLSLDQIAEKVKQLFDNSVEIIHLKSDDLRSYRVDSDKIRDRIGFEPMFTVKHSIYDLKAALESGKFRDPLGNALYYNIKRMKELALA